MSNNLITIFPVSNLVTENAVMVKNTKEVEVPIYPY